MASSTVTLSPPSLVSTITSILKHHRSKSRWHQISLLLSSPNTPLSPSQFSLITLSLRSSPRLALSFFNLTRRHSLCTHSLSSYSSLIHTLARSRALIPQTLAVIQSALIDFPNQALPLFQTLTLTYRKFDSAPVVFDLLIESVIRSKRFDLAIEIAKLLKSQGNSPTLRTCNLLIRCVFKQNGCLTGYNLYNEIFSDSRINRNVSTYNVIMLGFYREGLNFNLEGIWGEMEKRGVEPNVISYGILMKAYCEDRRMGEAERVWEEMREKGLERDEVAYATMIGGYCKIGEMGKAEEFFRAREMSGIEASYVSFEHLIKGYCEINNLGSALLLYNDMCRRGFRPEGRIVDVVIRGFCGERNFLEGLEFLRVAMREYEIFPKGEIYEFLIKGLCDEGMMEEALELQGEMVAKGFEPNLEIYNFFIDGYIKKGDDEMVKRLKKEIVDTRIMEGDD